MPEGPVEFWRQTAAVELPLVSYDTLTRNVRTGELTTTRDILAFRDEQDLRVSLRTRRLSSSPTCSATGIERSRLLTRRSSS